MKKTLLISSGLAVVCTLCYIAFNPSETVKTKVERKTIEIPKDEKKNSPEQRARFAEERFLHEYYRQVNPLTGVIPRDQKLLEFDRAKKAQLSSNSSSRAIETTYINRGPTNFGGRTRALVVDISDNTGNTMIAGGVSSGVFRTTNGGLSWTKVSSNDEIHSATSIVQDPNSPNIWYYGTGEGIGNSARLSGAFYAGQGIWKSENFGVAGSWALVPNTSSAEEFNNRFDTVFKLAVHPNGQLYAAINGEIRRYNGTNWFTEIAYPNGNLSSSFATDVVITTGGRVYASFSGRCDASLEGVWTSATGIGGWSRISSAGSNPDFTPQNDPGDPNVNGVGRVVLALAPSNQNKLYILFDKGLVSDCDTTPLIEAELWMWDQSMSSFTDYSSKLPDDPGCSDGNDPFAHQGGYDLVIDVRPGFENFVVIGGTNAYKKTDITAAGNFERIGGYLNASSYNVYDTFAGDPHHPDIHAMVFSPFNNAIMYTGTDGGIHRTNNIAAGIVDWTDLNTNYQTLQYYHVGIDPLAGSTVVIGGTQDNGTKLGGTDPLVGAPDLTTQVSILGGDGVSVAISRNHACAPMFAGFQNGRVFRTSLDYITCPGTTEITADGSDSQFVTLFHLDQSNNYALYYASKGVLYRTTDATNVTSSTWTNVGFPPGFGLLDGDEWFQTFSTSWGAYNAATSYLLMGGDEGHIYRLDNPQNVANFATAVDITPPTASSGTFPSIVTGLAIHPTNNNIILATYANYGTNSIFLSMDKGASWTLVERNLSAHSIRSAAIVEHSGETSYFVGTARGLYSNSDPLNPSVNWEREAPAQIGYAVVSDLKYRPSDHKLLIGTHGNGMYEATINSTLGIEDFNAISSLMKLYPNPVTHALHVKLLESNSDKVAYEVFNLSGQSITKGILEKEMVDVSPLTAGMYFLELRTDDGKKGVKSFVKQ